MPPAITVSAIAGIKEIEAGEDMAAVIYRAGADQIEPGDILAVASKIVSKAEDRRVHADDREQAITDETVREVARREHAGGTTRIVQNRNGLVLAAAGVDASNTPDGTVLLLPLDPDASARELRTRLTARLGFDIGVIITDTFGRPWRQGQTDAAIGAAGILTCQRLAGNADAHGRLLETTETAVADEIAAAADLAKGKANQYPVAVLRGLDHLLTREHGPGAQALVRAAEDDMFSMGTSEAYSAGYRQGAIDSGGT